MREVYTENRLSVYGLGTHDQVSVGSLVDDVDVEALGRHVEVMSQAGLDVGVVSVEAQLTSGQIEGATLKTYVYHG